MSPAASRREVRVAQNGGGQRRQHRGGVGRLVQPAGPALLVRFRSTGAEWSHWPVSEDEARRVMNPGREYNFSIGRAYGEIIRAYKSSRMVKPGERMETRRQREQAEQRAGRRWLA